MLVDILIFSWTRLEIAIMSLLWHNYYESDAMSLIDCIIYTIDATILNIITILLIGWDYFYQPNKLLLCLFIKKRVSKTGYLF